MSHFTSTIVPCVTAAVCQSQQKLVGMVLKQRAYKCLEILGRKDNVGGRKSNLRNNNRQENQLSHLRAVELSTDIYLMLATCSSSFQSDLTSKTSNHLQSGPHQQNKAVVTQKRHKQQNQI